MHQLASLTKGLVLVDLDRNLGNPLSWGELQNEADNEGRSTPEDCGPEGLSVDHSGTEHPINLEACAGCGPPLHEEDRDKNQDKDPVVEETDEHVEVFGSDDTTVDLVEKLQEYKRVKDDGLMLSLWQ